MTSANPPDDGDPRETFDYLSNEYAQALQAFQAIESQASTLMLMGYTDDLRQFIEQFVEMATRVRGVALERSETHFAEWFAELIDKAEKLRATVAQ